MQMICNGLSQKKIKYSRERNVEDSEMWGLVLFSTRKLS